MSGKTIGSFGAPGTGKSHFARSAANVAKVAVACIDPGEESFYLQHPKIGEQQVATFFDDKWRPFHGKYEATGYRGFMKWLDKQRSSDAQVIVIDPADELSDLIFHEVLKHSNTDDPREMPYGAAYIAHDRALKEAINETRALSYLGKDTIWIWHGRMREMEGAGDPEKGKSMQGDDVIEFEDRYLPAIGTNFRQHIAGMFQMWMYAYTKGQGPGTKYLLRATQNLACNAKVRVEFKAGVQATMLPNDYKSLLEAIK